MILDLLRIQTGESGTFGVLLTDREPFCWTLEPRERWNQRDKSSIPASQYECLRFHSQLHGDTWEITDVPLRSAILFHAGNVVKHTAGCVLLGETLGKLRGDRAVLNSGATFKRFMDWTRGYDSLHLTIREVY